MDPEQAKGEVFGAFTSKEKAIVAAVVGLVTIPVATILVIDNPLFNAGAAFVALTGSIPGWLFILTVARSVYEETDYLRLGKGIQVAAGGIPLFYVLTYIATLPATQSEFQSIITATVLTLLFIYITYRAIFGVLEGEESHYRVHGNWIAYYKDAEAAKQAQKDHNIGSGNSVNFEVAYGLLILVLALIFRITIPVNETGEQLFSALTALVALLAPFLILITIRIIEFDTYQESFTELVGRIAPVYLYGYIAALSVTVLTFDFEFIEASLWSLVSFLPFIVFTLIIVWMYKPSLITGDGED